jgi:hypothetical protein
MRQSNFQIAFSVEVFHSYFKENICNCLHFSPGPATRKLMKRFDCITNNKIGGFDFYTNSTGDAVSFFKYIRQTTNESSFDFDIQTDDSRFNCFTELPVDWVGQLNYDTNDGANKKEKGSIQLTAKLSEKMSSPALGNLVVRFDDIINTADKSYPVFTIRFSARSTQWQYYVINQSELPLDNPAIGKADIVFTGPEIVTIKSGQQALLFSSGSRLIPLAQVPGNMYSLINNSGSENDSIRNGAKTIVKRLPFPDPERFDFIRINDIKTVSSPMYVFI